MLRFIAAATALAVACAGCGKKGDDSSQSSAAKIDLPPPPAETGPIKRKIDPIAPPAGVDLARPPADAQHTPDGLVFKTITAGTGASPSKNDTVTVNYTGWHQNGEVFYSTKTKGHPMPLPLANVAPGFVEAVTMMKKGGRAVFWLPPEIGYKGKSQNAPETLAFDVELVDFKPAPPIPADVAAPPAGSIKTTKGIAIEVVKPGTGKDKVRYFDSATYHYTAWDKDGRMFDSTEVRGQPKTTMPFREPVGIEDALTQLVVGERARFWIPAELLKGSPNAPGGVATYELELISVTPTPKTPAIVPPDVAAPPKDAKKTASGVFYKEIKPGKGGDHPKDTDTVKVEYTGWTVDGRMFDSSALKGQPAEFALNGVIKGWTDGIPTMTAGGVTRFWIPVELAYNHQPGRPDGMLVFDVELLAIEKGGPPPGPGPRGGMMPPGAGGPHGAMPPRPPGHP